MSLREELRNLNHTITKMVGTPSKILNSQQLEQIRLQFITELVNNAYRYGYLEKKICVKAT